MCASSLKNYMPPPTKQIDKGIAYSALSERPGGSERHLTAAMDALGSVEGLISNAAEHISLLLFLLLCLDFVVLRIPETMSVSRFRHSTGHVAKPQRQLLKVSSSGSLSDGSNTIACSDKFVAVPWVTFGGTAVFTHDAAGRLPPAPPLVLGQEGPIKDVKFDPFDSQKLYTASEDGSIFGWDIPIDGLQSNISTPLVKLRGHKKCGIISFHPSANGILASAGADRVINVWDVEKGAAVTTIDYLSEYATGLEWNLNGSIFCVTTRDNKLQTIDPRNCTMLSSVSSHVSARQQRCVWCKRKDIILTLGWNRSQQREIKLWDTRKMQNPYSVVELDQSSAAMMPVYDEDTNLLFLGSKGESNLRCLELMEECLTMSYEVSLPDTLKGLCMMPKWSLDVRRCEFDRLYQLTYHSLLTVEMLLPRKQAGTKFQDDVFPPTFADHSAISASEFFNGANACPREYDLSGLFDGHAPLLIQSNNTLEKIHVASETAKDLKEVPTTKTITRRTSPSSPAVMSLERTVTESGDRIAKHVDPNSDMTHQELVDKKTHFQQLAEKMRTYHQEITLLRKALHEKEVEMLQLLEDMQSI
ncbi:hypothetical protein JKF63_04895 [Porcisia hertigi]|uniref:Coronin n=1 Tax=Porcisia hertigi TaxID=2761500 RepID=A0A836LHY5_9TRYP|nr:hypothetical protein JKF63_04895 [Porcisia hertigi]